MRRNKFNLSHYKLLTMNMGDLVPIAWYETLPGDTFQQSTSALVRVSPLQAPLMHPVKVRIHHWFVPTRLIWSEFEDFITGGPDGTSVPIHPYKSAPAISQGSLDDYLGVPPDAAYSPNLDFSALPRRAYQLIFNEHYRDQDLVSEAALSTASGLDTTTASTLQSVAWEKDYFTTAREWESKGDTVTIPIASADVHGIGVVGAKTSTGVAVNETGTGADTYADAWVTSTAGKVYVEEDPSSAGDPIVRTDETTMDINDLRLGLAIQRYQEARAKYGSRYVEYLRYLGVRSSDARLQNPEYLGGGRQIVQFSEVLQTDTSVGTMYGHGLAAMRTNRYRRFFEEHGIVMTLMSVVPKAIYSTAINRKFLREVKEDYFQKELQNLGDQEILNREVHTSHANYSQVFGYQQRYDEYRSHPSSIAGDFRSGLDHWHMARIYGSDPNLNSTFVTCSPTNRVYSSTTYDELYVMANHNVIGRRPLVKNASARVL